jgi:Ser-tRNA(Ala) deacylase AlaX
VTLCALEQQHQNQLLSYKRQPGYGSMPRSWMLDAARRLEDHAVRPQTAAGRACLVEIAGVDLKACRGTQARSIAEINGILVGKLENKDRQNRRISVGLAE